MRIFPSQFPLPSRFLFCVILHCKGYSIYIVFYNHNSHLKEKSPAFDKQIWAHQSQFYWLHSWVLYFGQFLFGWFWLQATKKKQNSIWVFFLSVHMGEGNILCPLGEDPLILVWSSTSTKLSWVHYTVLHYFSPSSFPFLPPLRYYNSQDFCPLTSQHYL